MNKPNPIILIIILFLMLLLFGGCGDPQPVPEKAIMACLEHGGRPHWNGVNNNFYCYDLPREGK